MVFDVKRFDIYRKIPKDLTQPTLTGAIISICSCTFMVTLFLSEFFSFISVDLASDITVDNPNSDYKIPVKLNISMPFLHCDYVGLDIQDELGRHEVGFEGNTQKHEIDEGRGCRFEGLFFINRVPGNFHVSTHSAHTMPKGQVNMAHHIHKLTFGEDLDHPQISGTFNGLQDRKVVDGNAADSHDYVLKIVPTIYNENVNSAKGQKLSYQYAYAYKSYISFSHTGNIIPAVWFRYDLSPIVVRYQEKRKPFYSFLTTVCAIVGGTFTVAGIIDSLLFSATELFKKAALDKLT